MVDNKRKKEILDKLSETNQIHIDDLKDQKDIIEKQELEIRINKSISRYNISLM